METYKYRFIFNREQAVFFIRNGANIDPNNIRINDETQNICFAFNNDDKLKELFAIWNKKSKQ